MRGALAAALATCLLALFPGQPSAQSDEQQTRDKLEQLERDIARIQQAIDSDTVERDKLQADLKSAEVTLGSLKKRIRDSEQDIDAGLRELADLKKEQATLEASAEAQQARIAVELRAAWQGGQQGELKLLLSQEQPDTLARNLTYYRYFLQARQARLTQYRETLTALADLRIEIDERLEALTAQRETLAREREQVAGAQAKRKQALSNLLQSLQGQAQELASMERSREELEGLLSAIEEAIDNIEVPEDYQAFAFASARGTMPWPLEGKFRNRFGRTRNESGMRWQGVTIPAEAGTTVQAIHHGRVVYADWLRGYGLLLILDHGDGYMSLYAHNQSLLRNVGEWVRAGAPLSTVGDSGGQERDALYFEVRKDGKPVNPAKWCRT